ncbi:MAG: TIGR01777 family oxidoreductase [Desulforhopalus sp.]
MKVLITGCSGLIGSALVEYLFQQGHSIQCLKRNKIAGDNPFWATDQLPSAKDDPVEVVIHLAGENIADRRWSGARKKLIMMSRVTGTRELVSYFSRQEKKPRLFLCASAVGYYGSRQDELLDENSSAGVGFLAEVCKRWENESHKISAAGIREVNLRFGLVLSPNGGALHKMTPAFKKGVGGTIGNGKQHISWISIRDLVAIVQFIIDNESLEGPVNMVSPIPTTNKGLTKSLGKALDRPTPFTVPTIAAKIIFGEMAAEMLLSSTRATPQKLLRAGYEFIDTSLDETVKSCVQSSRSDDP